MPRITAPTVAEHVRLQERAILDAAGQLFAERGVSGTDLGDIAAEVGLARSSLYRYFPDKDHILLAWFERELQPVIDQSASLLEGDDPPVERIVRWMRFQMDGARRSWSIAVQSEPSVTLRKMTYACRFTGSISPMAR